MRQGDKNLAASDPFTYFILMFFIKSNATRSMKLHKNASLNYLIPHLFCRQMETALPISETMLVDATCEVESIYTLEVEMGIRRTR